MTKRKQFKIEAGVPISPISAGRPKNRSKYPFDKMKAGDSFFVPSNGKKTQGVSLSKYALVKLGKGNSAIRRVEGGYRVWKIA